MIIILSSVFVLVFCMELANRIELGFQIERAEVGVGGEQPVSEEATPASRAPKTSAPARFLGGTLGSGGLVLLLPTEGSLRDPSLAPHLSPKWGLGLGRLYSCWQYLKRVY